MPGITGIIGHHRESGTALKRMVECMMHEPAYKVGSYVNEQAGLSVGWVCHEGAFSDCMPVWNERKDICLIFSGESFLEGTEVKRLKAAGHEFTPENAGYLVHLYEEAGDEFLERLNGWFSGVLLDLRKQTAMLFNDRYGLGRVYISETPEALFFSSEAKSILKVLPETRQLDFQGLADYYSCGCALQNRTLFKGISLLPPGSKWIASAGKPLRKELYFDRGTWEDQPKLKPEAFYHELNETFARILPKYFGGARKIGMSLTGGLDGRMIMACSESPQGTLPCYTFGGPYRDCVDVKLARMVAQRCGQPHQVIPVNGEFLAQFPALAQKAVFFSDGAMDVSGAAELYVNRIARQIAPVRLTGNYGSEILRGCVALRLNSSGEALLAPELNDLLQTAARTYASEAKESKLSFIAFKQVPWHHFARLSLEQSQLTLRSPYLDNELVALSYQCPPELSESPEPALRLINERNPGLGRIATDRGLLQRPIPVITSARNMYQEFMFRAEYAYDSGMPQWLARIDRTLAPLRLERVFLGRHKFQHYRIWYRDALAPYVKDVLLDRRTLDRPYLRRAAVEKVVAGHLRGDHNYTKEIHKALSLELIQRELIERNWN